MLHAMSTRPGPIEPEVMLPLDFSGLDEYQFEGNAATQFNKRMVLAAYRVKGTIYHAGLVAGVSRWTVSRWIERDPVFATAFEHCKDDCADRLETSIYERAFKSDLLAMFWLKAHRVKFRDKVAIDLPTVQGEIDQLLESLAPRRPESPEQIAPEASLTKKDDSHD